MESKSQKLVTVAFFRRKYIGGLTNEWRKKATVTNFQKMRSANAQEGVGILLGVG